MTGEKTYYRFIKHTGIIAFQLLMFLNSTAQEFENYSTSLPLIIIDTGDKTIPDEPKINCHIKIVSNASGTNKPTDSATDYDGNAGIEIRGSSSKYYPQKPYLFETRTENGENLNVSILGMPEENDWILLSNYNDKSFMRNILGYKLFQELGHYAPRSRIVEVFVNKTYQGIYILTEKIKQDKNRVDIAKLRPEDTEGEELTGGYIFKIDYWEETDSWKSPYSPIDHPDYPVRFVYHDPDSEELNTKQKFYIRNYVTKFESALYSNDFNDALEGYPNFIDVGSFIDYFIVSEISRNNDGFKKSRYFHKDKNGKIAAGPVWDFDWAWKNINECFIFKATDGSGWSYKVNDCTPWVKSPGWMVKLFEDVNLKNRTNCRYFEVRENILTNEYIFGLIDSVYQIVKEPQENHFRKWDILGINVGTPEIGEQPLTYEGEIENLKNWIETRLNWLDENMPGTCDGEIPPDLPAEKSFLVYPNPVANELNIVSNKTMQSIQLFNLTGRTVYSDLSAYKRWQKIEASNLAPGTYLVKIADIEGKSSTEKIIVY